MKYKKKAFVCFIAAVAIGLIFALAGIILISQLPRNNEIAVGDGVTAKTITASYQNEYWYYGDSAGNLVKMDDDGEVVAQVVISEEGAAVTTISSSSKLGFLFVADSDNNLYRVNDNGESLEKELIKSSCNFIKATADDDYVYLAMKASSWIQIEKYSVDDLTGDAVAKGKLYSCSGRSKNKTFTLLLQPSLMGLYVDDDYVYALVNGGNFLRMDKDFSINSFDFMSDEQKLELNASNVTETRFTLTTTYDKALYMAASNEEVLQMDAQGVAFDEEEGRFYVATTKDEFAALDKEFNKVFSITLSDTPEAGAFAFHKESKTVYVGYETTNTVTAIDVSGDTAEVKFNASVAFYITGMAVTTSGEHLFLICSGTDKANPDFKELYSADILKIPNKDMMKTLAIWSLVFAAAFLVVAVFAGLTAFKQGYSEKLAVTAKGIRKNWILYLIILASLSMLIAFCYYPGIASMILSFFDYTKDSPTMRFNNFENFITIFTNSDNLIALKNMLIFLCSDVIVALVPPVIFAFCLIFMRNKGYGTFARVVLFLPSVLPGIATLLIWKQGIYGVDGVINTIYRLFAGKDAEPILFYQDHGIASLIFMGFPFVGSYLIFYGALMNIAPSYYEAAELDGCPLFKRIFMIDLPMISPQIKYVFILAIIQSVQNFSRVLMTTDGSFGTQIPIVLMYKKLQNGDYGMSSAYATLMFLVLIVATTINMKMKAEEVDA